MDLTTDSQLVLRSRQASGPRQAFRAVTSLPDYALRILTARSTFVLFAVGILAYNILGSFVLRGTERMDYWHHLAAMRAFSESLLAPPNPYLASPTPTHLFTPYTWLWGAVSSILHVHPFYLVPLIGTLNLALFLVAVDAVAKKILGDRKWSLLLALSFFFLWWNPWEWSGFYDFGLIPLTSIYPYWLALALSLLLIAGYPFTEYRWRVVSIVVVALVFLIHPITALFLLPSLALKVLLSGKGSLGRRSGLAALPLAGIALAVLWPYFPVLEAVKARQHFEHTLGNYHFFYQGAFLRLLPAMLGALYVFYMAWHRRLDFVSSGVILFLLIYALNFWTLKSAPIARLIAFVALFLQLGTVLVFKLAVDNRPWRYLAVGLVITVLAVTGLSEVRRSGRRLRIEPWTEGTTSRDYYSRYQPYTKFINGKDVVLSDEVTSWILAPITGTKVVAMLHPTPFFPNFARRVRDVARFFHSDRGQMVQILERYRVTHVLVARDVSASLAPISEDLVPVFEDRWNVLFRYEAEPSESG